MSLAGDNKNWQGTQNPTYSYDRGMKPIAQPPCDLPSHRQVNEETDYIEVTRDRWNNEIPVDQTNHRNATAETGRFGSMQFADSQPADYLEGINEIPYGQGAAFNQSERVVVDLSKADRGKES